MKRTILPCIFLLLGFAFSGSAQTKKLPAVPDYTKVIPADVERAHNLGPTGLEGVMHIDKVRFVPDDIGQTPLTQRTRQIYVTKVHEGSPADGQVAVGDVIIGIGDKPFNSDPRVALGLAINQAEAEDGTLKLLCWRPDKAEEKGATERGPGQNRVATLKLEVLGAYSDTAPFDCQKSTAILQKTINAMLNPKELDGKKKKGINKKLDLVYLALLATGDEKHFKMVQDYALGVAEAAMQPGADSVERANSWHLGYRLLLLCEYYLLTNDTRVLKGIENYAVTASLGQSISGTWGHNMATPSYNKGKLHARLRGYGTMNQPSLTLFMGLVLAEKCGVKHSELSAALQKADVHFKHYTGKGAIPYGGAPAREYMQTNNGTSGTAALSLAFKGDKKSSVFFSRMCAGAHVKLETGHTGPFFNTMWTGLGANIAGPETYARFFKRWTWLRTLTRKWDGGFVYQRPFGGMDYRGLSSDAAMILHYSLPKRNLLITGRDQDESLWLKGKQVEDYVDVWEIPYEKLSDESLLKLLGHDIPMVRAFAAGHLAKRENDHVPALIKRLKGSFPEKSGACNALAELKEKAAPALPALMEIARNEKEDAWLRGRAVRAIVTTGKAGHKHAAELFDIVLRERPEDKNKDVERFVGSSLYTMIQRDDFDHAGHKKQIYATANRLMNHPHVKTRICGISMIEKVSLEDFHVVADSIVAVVKNDDPAYLTYSGDRPRQMGLRILDRLNIEDAIKLAIDTLEPDVWGYQSRIGKDSGRIAFLKRYGAYVKPYFPHLRKVVGDKDLADKFIKDIQASAVERKLITLEEAKNAGRKK